MEGEKEREREWGEEKESDEAEGLKTDEEDEEKEEQQDVEGAALVWQEGYGEDDLELPIMHWEALNLRIAELEKQEELRKERNAKCQSASSLERGRTPVSWMEERGQHGKAHGIWEDVEQDCHVMALTSRLQTQMNLQLCFINNSESEDDEENEEEKSKKRGTVQIPKQPQASATLEKRKSTRSIKNALRSLRDRLRTDHKRQSSSSCEHLLKRGNLKPSDLQASNNKELNALCISLSKAIQDLSSELVGRLQTRDQLKTEQDAMLLEIQDLTSL